MTKIIDLTGLKTGRLTVLKIDHKEERKDRPGCFRYFYLCKCSCGNLCVVSAESLKSGHTQSCGCFRKKLAKEKCTKHGLRFTKPYRIWIGILQRCENPKNISYKYYGGRGIKVCEEWHKPENFIRWAEETGYSKGLTIDRINTDGDYCPDNCRWATPKEQANNRRNTPYVTYKGQRHKLKDLCQSVGIEYKLVTDRLFKKNWSIEKAIETPKRNRKTT